MSSADRHDRTWPVVIVGAGPVGLALALGLARHGVSCLVLERNEGTSDQSRAPGIHVRTLEALGPWGAAERLRASGTRRETIRLHSPAPGRRPLLTIDTTPLADEVDRPGLLILEQAQTEEILLEAVRDAGPAEVRFGSEVVAVEPGPDATSVRYRDAAGEAVISARYVVGCDGASSFVREELGLPFPGRTYDLRPVLADVAVDDERDRLPWPRTDLGHGGITTAVRLRPGRWRLIRIDPSADADVDPKQVAGWLADVLGPGPFELVWGSRFRIHRRAAPRFRVGRVLLAGDAAHIHSPVGGLGMNAGIQDAQNLAWKLAAALAGGDEDRLLDSYETERRAVVVETVSGYTDALTRLFLRSPAPVRRGLFAVARGALRIPALRRRVARRTTMIDLDLPPSALLSDKDRAAGVRLPNLALLDPAGDAVRLHDVLPVGPALLEVAEDRDFADDLPAPHVVRIGRNAYRDPSGRLRGMLRGADGWILVRPDQHVAWARTERRELVGAVAAALGGPPHAGSKAIDVTSATSSTRSAPYVSGSTTLRTRQNRPDLP